jgi:hypothetical protein
VNPLLLSIPGAGKTFLARALAYRVSTHPAPRTTRRTARPPSGGCLAPEIRWNWCPLSSVRHPSPTAYTAGRGKLAAPATAGIRLRGGSAQRLHRNMHRARAEYEAVRDAVRRETSTKLVPPPQKF